MHSFFFITIFYPLWQSHISCRSPAFPLIYYSTCLILICRFVELGPYSTRTPLLFQNTHTHRKNVEIKKNNNTDASGICQVWSSIGSAKRRRSAAGSFVAVLCSTSTFSEWRNSRSSLIRRFVDQIIGFAIKSLNTTHTRTTTERFCFAYL